jgi:hypothetical protein
MRCCQLLYSIHLKLLEQFSIRIDYHFITSFSTVPFRGFGQHVDTGPVVFCIVEENYLKTENPFFLVSLFSLVLSFLPKCSFILSFLNFHRFFMHSL